MRVDAFDIAVIGSGFAGSLMAMIARRLNRSVVLIEKGSHPRFAIGESSTPLANLILEELAQRYDLPRVVPLTKWGTWQEHYPELGCGLKRGFSFFHHEWDVPFRRQPDRSNELLVAASPNSRIADTHWFRADFDEFLVREAQALGVTYLDQTTIHEVDTEKHILEIERAGATRLIKARFIVDASGPRGVLHRRLKLDESGFSEMPRTQALFSHFSNVLRLDSVGEFKSLPELPYPIDDAAVHHVFPGGWIWVLRFNNGITSAGVAAREEIANEMRFEEGCPAWKRLLDRLPGLKGLFASANVERPFVHLRPLSFRSGRAVGNGWALLPSAAGFVDPLLSTGFPLTLLGIERLARYFEKWNDRELTDYETATFSEIDSTAKLVAALYATMDNFRLFSKLSLLYFAAASFAETRRRLNRDTKDRKFLLGDNGSFTEGLRSCCSKAMSEKEEDRDQLLGEIRRTIYPVDVAGLSDETKHNWYPVEAADLLNAAGKLDASELEIKALLTRCGF